MFLLFWCLLFRRPILRRLKNNFSLNKSLIGYGGPFTNECFHLSSSNNQLLVAAGTTYGTNWNKTFNWRGIYKFQNSWSFFNRKNVPEKVIFKIQIASSKNKIKVKSYNFRGLKNVQRVKVGSYYKYYYGITSDYEEVKNALLKAKKKGFSDAYIAVFENGKKTSLSKVLK